MKPEELNATRIFVLQRAIGALIETHPAPERFAHVFAIATGLQQLDQIGFVQSQADVRDESRAFAQEILTLAADEAARRRAPHGPQTPPAG